MRVLWLAIVISQLCVSATVFGRSGRTKGSQMYFFRIRGY